MDYSQVNNQVVDRSRVSTSINTLFTAAELYGTIKIIGKLVYHNFITGDDLINIIYKKTKEDQDGEKIKDTYIYANRVNPLFCSSWL